MIPRSLPRCFLLLLAGCVALASACSHSPLTMAQSRQQLLSMSQAELSPFTHDDASLVADSLQHLRHVRAGRKCSDCHSDKQPLQAREVERACRRCHETRTVDDKIWKYHCQSCHPFSSQTGMTAGNYDTLARFCVQCHTPQEGAAAFGACLTQRNPKQLCTECHNIHSGTITTGPPQAYRFTTAEEKQVVGNAMHEKHLSQKLDCTACHEKGAAIDAKEATAQCSDCHLRSSVAKDVWNEHCLACHAFTKADENAMGSPRVAQRLCEDCHTKSGDAETIYGFCQPGATHNITCQRCHQPHKSAVIAGENVCASCHEDIVGKTHPSKKVHGACIMCHSPHKARKLPGEMCSKCHLANQTVLVHRIPGHPEDCLACHSPHFTEVDIVGDACLKCHQGMFYSGGRRQPKEHRNCENCHDVASFKYVGDGACAKCHPKQAPVLSDKRLNAQHRYCITCHKPHTWRATFASSCEACHETELVIEHQMPFHKLDCDKCHDAHGTATLARSGNCQGCHSELKIPNFKANSPDEHNTCDNCHPPGAAQSKQFSFVGAQSSCLVCHPQAGVDPALEWADVPSGHQQCLGCHAPHAFKAKPAVDSCGVCHPAVFAQPPAEQHADCYNCHQVGHKSLFVGEDVSCAFCHPQAAQPHGSGDQVTCITCHTPHEFKADPQSCTVCHGDVQAEAAASKHSDCNTCHGGHTWQAGSESCGICHPQLEGEHKSLTHAPCLNCHSMHSMRVDTASCLICHTARPPQCTSDNCIQCHTFRAPAAPG
jgi:hypothetical protein